MNVKPGDFAQVISGPNKGTLCIVLEAATWADLEGVRSIYSREEIEAAGLWWAVRLLHGTKTYDIASGMRVYRLPGHESVCLDRILKRIDPRADDTTDEAGERLPEPLKAVPA